MLRAQILYAKRLLTLSAALFSAIPVAAAADPRSCEIHVWPTTKFNGTTNSIFPGGAIGGTHKNETARDRIARIMSPKYQSQVFRSLDWNILLNVNQDFSVFIEKEADNSKIKVGKFRLSSSNSECYIEILVQWVGYAEDPYWGKDVGIGFLFRRFDSPSLYPSRTFRIAYGKKIKANLTRESDAAEADEIEIRTAIQEVIDQRLRVFLRK